MGRATGFFRRTGSGTSAQTSGCDCRISGTRSTVAASALSPRSARPCSSSAWGFASKLTRWQVAHSPQKSSVRRSQFAAWANIRASVYLPTPREPVNSKACGTRPVRRAPRSAVTIRSLPRNSAKPMRSATFSRLRRNGCAEERRHGGHHVARNFFNRAHRANLGIEAFNGNPGGAASEMIVHSCRILQMAQAGFQKILLGVGIAALRFERDQFLGFHGGNAQIQDEILAGKVVDVVLEVLDPAPKILALFGSYPRGLMGEIGANVTVDQNDFAFIQGRVYFGFGLEAI